MECGGGTVKPDDLVLADYDGIVVVPSAVAAEEPHVPAALLALPNVVLAPHIGSATRQTREAMTRVLVDNLLAAAGGRALPTPVPVPA